MTTIKTLLYNDGFWAAILLFSFVLLIVGVVADLCRTKPRRIT